MFDTIDNNTGFVCSYCNGGKHGGGGMSGIKHSSHYIIIIPWLNTHHHLQSVRHNEDQNTNLSDKIITNISNKMLANFSDKMLAHFLDKMLRFSQIRCYQISHKNEVLPLFNHKNSCNWLNSFRLWPQLLDLVFLFFRETV